MKLTRKSFLKLAAFSLLSPLSSKIYAAEEKEKNNILNFGANKDGKRDSTQALKNALKKGSTCYIPSGKFIIKDLNIENCLLYGEGTIVLSSKYSIGLGKNVQINGLTFSGNTKYENSLSNLKVLDGSKNIKIINCTFNSQTYSAISADVNGISDKSLTFKDQAESILINKCIFSGKYSRHLYLHSIKSLTVSDNTFKDSGFDSIRLRQNVEDINIHHNTFKNIGTQKSSDTQDAIDTYWSGNKLIISHNIIDGCAKHGLDIKGHAPSGKYGSENIIISNNQIRNAKHCGIVLSAGAPLNDKKIKPIKNIIINSNILEKNNLSKTPGNAAIQIRHGVQDSQIINNNISNNFGRGIFAFNAVVQAPQLKNIIVSKNICKDNGDGSNAHGIILSSVLDLICSENICENTNSGPTQKVGLAIVHDEKRGFKKTQGIIKDNLLKGHSINKI